MGVSTVVGFRLARHPRRLARGWTTLLVGAGSAATLIALIFFVHFALGCGEPASGWGPTRAIACDGHLRWSVIAWTQVVVIVLVLVAAIGSLFYGVWATLTAQSSAARWAATWLLTSAAVYALTVAVVLNRLAGIDISIIDGSTYVAPAAGGVLAAWLAATGLIAFVTTQVRGVDTTRPPAKSHSRE